MTKFAVVVDGKVRHTIKVNEGSPVGEKWGAALRSNVKLTKSSGYAFEPGDVFTDGVFYRPDSSGTLQKLEPSPVIEEDIVFYLGVIDNEVIGGYRLHKSKFSEDRLKEIDDVFNSNYAIIEAPSEVDYGWTWDGESFSPAV